MTVNGNNTHSGRLAAGIDTRRAVLGAQHVDRSLAQATEFSRPMQELVTEYCWGAVWSRPGLSRRDRSLLNVAMLTALNRPHELALHVRGALNNGVTPAELREVLLQACIYSGVPAGMDAYRTTEKVLIEQGYDLGEPS
ncbi:carboxymuconolactone decarboxylase family protein [Nocardia sp. NPDC127579]|uniref:carboxymuconolactone decarboxylase family protein n=1 Tax=Nocardia sp. NPDC127579 TaxID=3345402 RepID=UPI00362F9CD6